MSVYRQTQGGSEKPDPRLLRKAARALRKRKQRLRRHSPEEMLALWEKCRKSGIHRTSEREANSVLYEWSTRPSKRKKRRKHVPKGKLPIRSYEPYGPNNKIRGA